MKSNVEWKIWGRVDPLYAVAKIPGKSKNGTSPWQDREFYASGSRDWRTFICQWSAYGVARRSCLEIGCGAGRITQALSRYFDTVHAIDVSTDMLEYAKRHVRVETVHFHLTDGRSIPLEDRSIESVFSTHVFQHLDNTACGERYFREIYRVLRPGGTMMVHLPITAWPDPDIARTLHGAIDTCRRLLGQVRRTWNLWAYGIGLRKEPTMRITWYEASWLHDTLQAMGFKDIEIWISFSGDLGNGRHPFVLARK